MKYLEMKKKAILSVIGKVKGFVRSVSGTPPIALEACADNMSIIDYKIHGNSIQDGTPSPDNPIEVQSVGEKTKNLFDEELLLDNSKVTKTDDGYIIAGYPVIYGPSSTLLKHIKSVLKPNVTYTLSRRLSGYVGDSIGSIWIRNSSTNIVKIALGNGVKSAKFTFTQDQIDSIVNIYIYGQNTGNLNAIFHYIQLEEGEVATDYELYGYKIPVTARSKNLLDVKSAYLLNGDSTTVKTETGFISHRGYMPADVYDITSVLKPNTTYYVHRDLFKYDSDGNEYIFKGDGNSVVGQIKIVFDDGSRYYQYSFGGYVYYVDSSGKGSIFSKTGLCTFVTPSSFSKVTINTYLSPGNNPNIQDYDPSKTYYTEWKNVYLGTEPYTDYEPYHEPITTNIYLDEPLRKVGDYADYIDFKNSMVVRNISKYPLVMPYPGSIFKKGTNTVMLSFLHSGQGGFVKNSKILCPIFKNIQNAWYMDLETIHNHNELSSHYYCGLAWSRLNLIYDGTKAYRSDDETQTELTDKQITDIATAYLKTISEEYRVVYAIPVTPTETSISLPILPTFKGLTTVYEVGTTIQPSNMEAEYYSTLKGE